MFDAPKITMEISLLRQDLARLKENMARSFPSCARVADDGTLHLEINLGEIAQSGRREHLCTELGKASGLAREMTRKLRGSGATLRPDTRLRLTLRPSDSMVPGPRHPGADARALQDLFRAGGFMELR